MKPPPPPTQDKLGSARCAGSRMRSLFVMDPLDRIVVDGDSTYVTMRECTDRGFPVWMCTPDQLYSLNGRTHAVATPIRTTEAPPYFHPEPSVGLDLGEVDVVWMRKDPPFDMTYIFTTYLLDMVGPNTLVVNHPRGLKLFNEKMWVQQQWPQFQPDTLITNEVSRIVGFVRGREGRTVLKPWDGNGGRGCSGDGPPPTATSPPWWSSSRREGQALRDRTGHTSPTSFEGDKRILLIRWRAGGRRCCACPVSVRPPRQHARGSGNRGDHGPRRAAISEIVRRPSPLSIEASGVMVFVGIDVIGGHLTEINVTSPTGIREINRLYGAKKLESGCWWTAVLTKVAGIGESMMQLIAHRHPGACCGVFVERQARRLAQSGRQRGRSPRDPRRTR